MARQLPGTGVNLKYQREPGIERGDVIFTKAGPADEGEIRRLLRENPLGGNFQITMEREPHAFAGDFGHPEDQVFIIARDRRTGEAVGLCERSVRDMYVNGKARKLPYLGALRITAGHRHRIGILKGGFEALRIHDAGSDALPFALTSITEDNETARRLLTAGLPGLPLYRPVGHFSTFALRSRPRKTAAIIETAGLDDLAEIASLLREMNARFQFSTVWTADQLSALSAHGLEPEHFFVARRQGRLCGCLAVWDQTGFRQTVIRRYPSLLRRLRHVANAVSPLTGVPRLPPSGTALRQATLSHLAIDDRDPDLFTALVDAALDQAYRRGFPAAVIGFASMRPLREMLRRHLRPIEYRTALYLAHWKEAAREVSAIDATCPHPELGLL